jgi:hypothetical protein
VRVGFLIAKFCSENLGPPAYARIWDLRSDRADEQRRFSRECRFVIALLPDVLNASVAQPRFRTLLLGMFGAIALILAAIGIFGVISYSVSRRAHELGIRMALGAQPGSVLRMILRETLTLTLVGIAVGAPCPVATARLIYASAFSCDSLRRGHTGIDSSYARCGSGSGELRPGAARNEGPPDSRPAL